MSELKLGELITGEAHRDAIHVAVAPVVAGETIGPGDHLELKDGVAFVAELGAGIGIADPFLQGSVAKDERFYLWLYPNTVTGMRHEWRHPAFDEGSAKDRTDSEAWLMQYAKEMNCYEEPASAFETLIDGLRQGELFAHGSDLHGFYDLDHAEDLKFHAERYLGIRIEWDRFTFSCSC